MSEAVMRAVLDFWLGAEGSPERGTYRDMWFRAATPALDAEIRETFLAAHEDAAAGRLDHLMDTADGCLALLILLDQFPRNMFRGTARAFATDAKARAVAAHALAQGFDKEALAAARTFFYLPFMHSEDLADQDRAVALAESLENERSLEAAREHRDVIARFGRFPHRNAVLGRDSTPDELEHLKDGKTWGQGAPQDDAAAGSAEAAG